jgi:hypothetical protein
MSADISLLPEDMRKKEEDLKTSAKQETPKDEGAGMKFFIPAEEGEDIEVIEVDEGEIDQVLAGEPTLTKIAFYATSFVEDIKTKLFSQRPAEAPAKVPPQFFKPPEAKKPVPGQLAAGQAPAAGAGMPGAQLVAPAEKPVVGGAPGVVPLGMAPAKAKAQVAPYPVAPKRVRVIRRVRKPVRVSFVSDEDLRLMHVDVRKRKFTFAVTFCLFLLLGGGGYALLDWQKTQAQDRLVQAQAQVNETQRSINEKLRSWSSFQSLEPKLKTLAGLLDQHVSPTKLLRDLEDATLPTVYYENFSVTPDRRVTLSVITDSLESAAKQLVAFRQADFVKSADASSYTIEYDPQQTRRVTAVRFQMSVTLSDSALKPLASAEPTQ